MRSTISLFCRFDEVSMLENNLKELQLEYKRSQDQSTTELSNLATQGGENSGRHPSPEYKMVSAAPLYGIVSQQPPPGHHVEYESFNLDRADSSEELRYQQVAHHNNSLVDVSSGVGGDTKSAVATTARSNIAANGSRAAEVSRRASIIRDSTKPVLEGMARTVSNNVRDYLPNKSILTSLNPFGNQESDEDEYDASGKNPFSE